MKTNLLRKVFGISLSNFSIGITRLKRRLINKSEAKNMDSMMYDSEKELTSKVDLRDKIVEKAGNAFRLHGIKSITMDEIAASLGISKRTLYEVYEDKESLLKACILRDQQKMNNYLKEVLTHSANVIEVVLSSLKQNVERFHSTHKRFFEDVKKYPEVCKLIKSCHEADSEKIVAFFNMGVEQGLFRSDINFKIVNELVREQMGTLLESSVCKEYSILEVYESIMFINIRGIATEKGAQMLEDFIVEYRQRDRQRGVANRRRIMQKIED